MEKELRLSKRDEFNKVYRYGKSSANKQFVLYYFPQPHLIYFRLGVSVSKKIGNAVTRNRIRRMLKEIIRLNKSNLKLQTAYIFIARQSIADITYQDMEKSVIHLLRKNSLYTKQTWTKGSL